MFSKLQRKQSLSRSVGSFGITKILVCGFGGIALYRQPVATYDKQRI